MVEGPPDAERTDAASIPAAALVSYVEDMLQQLAELASSAGEAGLASSLTAAALQAGASRRKLLDRAA